MLHQQYLGFTDPQSSKGKDGMSSSPAASGAVLSPSHPWRKDERGFPLTKKKPNSQPLSNLCADPAGPRRPILHSMRTGKTRKRQAVTFFSKVSLEKDIPRLVRTRSRLAPCASLSSVMPRSALLLKKHPWHFAKRLVRPSAVRAWKTPGKNKRLCRYSGADSRTRAALLDPPLPIMLAKGNGGYKRTCLQLGAGETNNQAISWRSSAPWAAFLWDRASSRSPSVGLA